MPEQWLAGCAFEAGDNLDARVVLLTLHASVIQPSVVSATVWGRTELAILYPQPSFRAAPPMPTLGFPQRGTSIETGFKDPMPVMSEGRPRFRAPLDPTSRYVWAAARKVGQIYPPHLNEAKNG